MLQEITLTKITERNGEHFENFSTKRSLIASLKIVALLNFDALKSLITLWNKETEPHLTLFYQIFI